MAEEKQRSVSDLVWDRNDTLLLAGGSIPCIRTMYFRARELGKLHQFAYVVHRESDYILGSAEDVWRNGILAVGNRPGLKILVLYLSCLDVLTCVDIDGIIREVQSQVRCRIVPFWRGPLTAHIKDRGAVLREALARTPPEGAGIAPLAEYMEVPPPAADVCGAMEMLRGWGDQRFVITPGGCMACMHRSDMREEDVPVKVDIRHEVVYGAEDYVTAQLGREAAPEEPCVMAGTCVSAFIGFEPDAVRAELGRPTERVGFVDTHGFDEAMTGAEKGLQLWLQTHLQEHGESTHRIGILGYSPMLWRNHDSVSRWLERPRAEREGIIVYGQDGGTKETFSYPEMCWALSLPGWKVAQKWAKERGIPVTIGSDFIAELLVADEYIFAIDGRQVPLRLGSKEAKELLTGKHCVITGDPVQVHILARILREKFQAEVTGVVYQWSPKIKTWCRDLPEEYRYWRNLAELRACTQDADVIIGDALLADSFAKKVFIHWSWPVLGGLEK